MRRAGSEAGLSLIELVMVIVILAIAAAAIGSAFVHSSRSLRLNEDVQRAWQMAHECADHVLGSARRPGAYAAVLVASPSTICSLLPVVTGFTRVVNVTGVTPASSAVAAVALCNSITWGCRRVQIVVQQGAATMAALNFMLVQY